MDSNHPVTCPCFVYCNCAFNRLISTALPPVGQCTRILKRTLVRSFQGLPAAYLLDASITRLLIFYYNPFHPVGIEGVQLVSEKK